MSSLRELAVSRQHPARKLVYRDGRVHVVLRPTTVEDAEILAAAVQGSRSELQAFMPWSHAEQSAYVQLERLKAVEAEYWAGKSLAMGLFAADGGEFLVSVGLEARVPLNPNGLEIGYWTMTAHAGRGLATLGVRMAIAYAFEHLGCDRLQVLHDETNHASRRVIEKCGFVFEGTLRNAVTPPTPELAQAGFRGTERHRLYALWPEDRARLDWYAPLLARLEVYNIGGYRVAHP
ncbi:MAG TPA: GNAT family N-acetyltransferase [Polyangia bacterium]|jgi:RimJ/RimL family protein N-acetyltransferase|nr:GNAT family N-acetyltransferase [Polyangia bacterium]